MYDANMFVKKNQDTLPSDLLECVKKSSNRLVCKEFSKGEDSGNVASSKANLSRRGSRSSSKHKDTEKEDQDYANDVCIEWPR